MLWKFYVSNTIALAIPGFADAHPVQQILTGSDIHSSTYTFDEMGINALDDIISIRDGRTSAFQDNFEKV